MGSSALYVGDVVKHAAELNKSLIAYTRLCALRVSSELELAKNNMELWSMFFEVACASLDKDETAIIRSDAAEKLNAAISETRQYLYKNQSATLNQRIFEQYEPVLTDIKLMTIN